MPRGFTISHETLAEELRDAIAGNRREEMRDLELLVDERTTKVMGYGADGKAPTAIQKVDIRRARNRQSQRRFQRKWVGVSTLLAPGDQIRDPYGHPFTVTVTSVVRAGRNCNVQGVVDNESRAGWSASLTPRQVRALRHIGDGTAPTTPSPDLAGTLAASVVVNAARAFLEALDAYVAGEVEAEAYQTYRSELEACLVTSRT